MLNADEIKEIAVQEVAGVVEEIELETKSGKLVYEVDIEKDDVDYDLAYRCLFWKDLYN